MESFLFANFTSYQAKMTSDPCLYQWVVTLTDPEYKELRGQLKAQRGTHKTQLQILLEGLRAMPAFDSDAEKAILKGKSGNLPTLKRQLEARILDFLVKRQREDNRIEDVRMGVKQVLVALDRHQDDRAEELIAYWKGEAIEMEQPDLWLELLKLERRLLKKNQLKGIASPMAQNIEDARRALSQFSAIQLLLMIHDELFIRVRQEFRVRSSSEEEWLLKLEQRVLQHQLNEMSFDGRRFYWSCLASIAKLRGNGKDYYQMMLNLMQEWNARPQLQALMRREYRVSLANLLSAGHESRQFGHFPDVLSQVSILDAVTPDEQRERQQILDLYGLLLLLYTPQRERLAEFSTELYEKLRHKETDMISSTGMAIWFNLAVSFLALGDREKCARSLDQIHHLSKTGHRKDVRFGADLIRIILLLTEEDTEQALQKVESLLKLLRDHKHLDEGEKLVLNALRSYLTLPAQQKNQRLETLENKLSHYLDARLRSAPGLHESLYFIQSRLQQVSMMEILQRKAND